MGASIHPLAAFVSRGSTMPIHDWSKVDAGIFHHFHHAWIEETAQLPEPRRTPW